MADSWAFTKVHDWKNYAIPARPCPSELEHIEKEIIKLKNHGKSEVAILGSTVEFRSLCHKHNMNVTVIDFKKENYKILSKQPMIHGPEIFMEEDWKTMSTDKRYDLLLGCTVLNVVGSKNIPVILENISKIADIAILRTFVRSSKLLDPKKVIAKNRKKHAHPYTAFGLDLYLCYYDCEKESVDISAMFKGLKSLMKNKTLTNKEYSYFYSRLKHEGGNFTIPLREEIENKMKKYFKIINIKYAKEHFKNYYPLYFLTPLNRNN